MGAGRRKGSTWGTGKRGESDKSSLGSKRRTEEASYQNQGRKGLQTSEINPMG